MRKIIIRGVSPPVPKDDYALTKRMDDSNTQHDALTAVASVPSPSQIHPSSTPDYPPLSLEALQEMQEDIKNLLLAAVHDRLPDYQPDQDDGASLLILLNGCFLTRHKQSFLEMSRVWETLNSLINGSYFYRAQQTAKSFCNALQEELPHSTALPALSTKLQERFAAYASSTAPQSESYIITHPPTRTRNSSTVSSGGGSFLPVPGQVYEVGDLLRLAPQERKSCYGWEVTVIGGKYEGKRGTVEASNGSMGILVLLEEGLGRKSIGVKWRLRFERKAESA